MARRRGYKASGRAKIVVAILALLAIWLAVELGLHNALGELMVLPLTPNQSG